MNKLYCTLAANFLLFTLFFQPTNPAKKCGTPIGTVLSDNRIVGGVDVGYYKYPWYVALMHEDEIYCGGTLVSNRYIVSAAHCYEDYFEKASAGKIKLENVLTPIFGVYNICDTTEVTQKKNKISKVFIHEKYNKNANYYDISLLKLKKKAKGFEPCCLPTHVYNSEQRPKEAIITGLGDQIFHDKNATCTLREARILIHSDAVCKKMLDDSGEKGSELHDAFCAGYLQGGIDACQGDSGGPLMILGPESKYILLGVVSFGEGCAKPNRLGVYTDVSKYLDWIYKKMKRPNPPGSTSPPTTSTNQPTGSSQTTPGSTSTGETVTPTKVTPSTASTSEPTDETDEPDESTIPSQTTSASGYHPSTYTFSTDLYTSTEPTERPYHPPYEHNRPIIIIINKKEMQKNKRKRGNCQADG